MGKQTFFADSLPNCNNCHLAFMLVSFLSKWNKCLLKMHPQMLWGCIFIFIYQGMLLTSKYAFRGIDTSH